MIGKTLGHYQITDKIGEGGMGIVYKARDTHLDRFVAIKVLAAEKVADPDRKRRFVQEAKAASALNHPNIVHVYDIDQSDGTDYIAMEYVDGKTLDQRIGHRGLRLSDALKYGVQIADALAKAHSAGIVHRDLKPTNIMVNEDGVVKVFDFGLAKLTEQIKGDETASTATVDGEGRQITEEGVIVGTVAYMSPEQAEGKKVDARSDIFSLGSVLYEMVTGQKAFHGTSKMSTLSAILHQEPKPVSGITPTIPADLEKLINRCLRKDPQRRWQNMADLKVALDELKEDSDSGRLKAVPARERVSTPVRLLLIAVAVITIVAIGWYWLRRQRRAEPVAPLVVVPLTSYPGEESSPSFSPDGNQVAFSWNGEKEDNFDIYVKLIKSPKPLRLTTDPAWDGNPAFSPDGQSIAFARILNDRVAILLVPAIGGPERLLAEFRPASAVSLSWFPDGKWIATDGIAVISVETGEIRKLTSLPTGSFRDHTPAISPDGRTIVFSRADGVSEIYLLGLTPDLKPKGEPKQLTHLNRQSDQPVWTADGHNIIFTSALAWELNLWRVSLSDSGGPKPLFVGSNKDRSPTISHQGNRLAFTRRVSDRNIYRLSLTEATAKSSQPVRFLQSSRDEFNPKYSPDGTLIAFESDRTGSRGIWVSDAEGSNLVEVFGRGGSPRWSPDGQRLVFDSDVGGTAAIYVVRASGGKPVRLTYGPQASTTGSWSHDGNWIYFCSERDGQDQIWKIPAEGGDAVQVTGDGGFWPVESPDGKSLYFMRWSGDGNNKLWKIPVSGGVGSQILPSLFLCNYELMDDGIYFIRRPDKSGKAQLQFLSFAANAARTITTLPGQITFGLAVSPDRRYLLYSTDDLSGSDLMLVENFR